MDRVIVYQDSTTQWRWRRVSENGRIVSTSGEAYVNHGHATRMATELNPDAEVTDTTRP